MPSPRSDFLHTAVARGYLHQCTDLAALDDVASARAPAVAYIGYDCTAPSLHAGSLLSIMLLRLLQKTGHKPIILLGGGTSKVGDPSGKDEARSLLSDAEIDANMLGIRQIFSQFLKFGDGPTDAFIVNNAEWLDNIPYISFLRDYGRHFSVNRMLTFDSVRLRLEREQPLSFLEFNYMVLQAYDFLELSRRYDCRLQMGGADQWGNIVAGVDLGRRIDGTTLFGLTTPLLTTSGGAKMGKTASGAVWLSADRTPPYEFWQYWRNSQDSDVGRFLRLFTETPLDEVVRLESLAGAEVNHAKRVLATEVTRICHGDAAAAAAAETARQTFEEGTSAAGLPTVAVPARELSTGIPAFDLFRRSGLTSTNSEARRLIKSGGARINDIEVASETQSVTEADINADGVIKLSAGRKRHALVRRLE